MEDHCMIHSKKMMEYVCPCKNIPLCKACKLAHEAETGHATEDCKEVGLAILHQHIQCAGGSLAKTLAKGLREIVKELEAGFLREIDGFQESCVQTEELRKMRKLDSDGRYAELYSYAKSLHVGGAKNEAAVEELNKRLLDMIDTASAGLNKMRNRIAVPQHKPVFASYKKDEVLVFKDKSYNTVGEMVSALHNADMSTKVKAAYIDLLIGFGDRATLELASRLQTHPVSALYLKGYISDAAAEVLAQAAFRGKSISAFCVWSIIISDTGAKAVAEAARNCRSLTTFYLVGYRISETGAKTVAEAVKSCPLSVFYLGSAYISDSGAAAVAEAVKGCPLSAFCLWSCEISDAGAIAMAKTVKDCLLSVFYLEGSKMSDSGATAVAETLSSGRCASTLSAFYMCVYKMPDSGAKKVADAIRGCTRLSEFYLYSRLISGETVTYILKGMAGVSTIRSVNLCIGEISKEQMDSCLDQLQQSGNAKQLKLRLRCETEAANSVCEKFAAEWNAKLSEFRIVGPTTDLFENEVLLGMPR